MANSLMEYLLNAPSGADRLMGLLPLVQQKFGAPGSVDPNASGGTYGNDSGTNVPSGPTKYNYTEYDRPYSGVPDNLITRWGVTLQPGPMHSLLDIARASDRLPGARELKWIGQGYRSYAAQAAAGGTPDNPGGYNPIATTAGNSYHGQGLAIDAGTWATLFNEALRRAGWNQFDRAGDPTHYSYGVTG